MCRLQVSTTMNFMNNFDAQPEAVQPKRLYQNTTDTSQHWRMQSRIVHPLTKHQFGNTFRVGDRVRMRFLSTNGVNFEDFSILNIIKYETAKQVLGSYNIDDSFRGVPFTHTLVLERS